MRFEPAPMASLRKISGSPVREDEKASLPSGDHAGDMLVPPKAAKETIRPSSREYMRICQPVAVMELKATRELSGEGRGEREMEPIWVRARAPLPSQSITQISLLPRS